MNIAKLVAFAENVRPYSGRGMYGKECAGLAFHSQSEAQEAIAELIIEIVGEECDARAIRKLMAYRTDTLGHGLILYWPEVSYGDVLDERGELEPHDEDTGYDEDDNA